MMALSRAIWLATGIAWAVRSLMGLADPDYVDPVTALDWSSVWLGALVIRPAWFATPGPTPALTAVSPPSS